MRLVRLEPAPFVAAVGVLTSRGEGVAPILGASALRLRRMDRYQSLGYAAACLALEEYGRAPREKGDRDWGVLLGSSTGCWSSNAQFFLDLAHRTVAEWSPALFARTVSNAVNGEISIDHQIGGPSETFVSGWTAGADALVQAAALLAQGKARAIVAGGVEAPSERVRRMFPGSGALTEAAGACVLTREGEDRPRLSAYVRGRDPRGSWSPPLGMRTVVVANTVAPELLARWRQEAQDAELIVLAERTGELGAAGAPVGLALALSLPLPAAIVSRGLAGEMVALFLER